MEKLKASFLGEIQSYLGGGGSMKGEVSASTLAHGEDRKSGEKNNEEPQMIKFPMLN